MYASCWKIPTPRTSSYAPIVLVIEDTDVQRGYNIDNICLRCSCHIGRSRGYVQ